MKKDIQFDFIKSIKNNLRNTEIKVSPKVESEKNQPKEKENNKN